MTPTDRDDAWREYAMQLGQLNVSGETLESAEIDFKAGFDAARYALGRRGERAPATTRASRFSNAGR